MAAIEIDMQVSESGEIRIQLPDDFPKGEIRVRIESRNVEDVIWTESELEQLQALMQSEPSTGKEIAESDVIGSWAHLGITDSVAWVEEQRRRQRERRQWSRD